MMKTLKYLLPVLVCFTGLTAYGASAAPIRLTHAYADTNNIPSIKRGAKFYATHCMVCHAMRQLKYDAIAIEAGVTYDKMPLKGQDWWFGVTPPDLSLSARVRSADWIYTYLHSFYKDPSHKLGTNNLLMPNSSMPNPFGGMQGDQMLKISLDEIHQDYGVFATRPSYFAVLEMERQGSMTPAEFDQTIYDVVNFLVYASDPSKLERQQLGWWVLAFLFVFVVITYLLAREYWRGVK